MISCACPMLQSSMKQIQTLKDILAAFAGEDAAKELAKEPAMVPFNILNDYGELLAKIQGVELENRRLLPAPPRRRRQSNKGRFRGSRVESAGRFGGRLRYCDAIALWKISRLTRAVTPV